MEQLTWPELETSEIVTVSRAHHPSKALRGTMVGHSSGSVCEPTAERASKSAEAPKALIDISTGDTVKINLSKPRPAVIHDECAAATAISLLAQSGVAELRFLRVDESDDEICLSGHVRSYYHKQLAQETVRVVAAGRQVINRVSVSVS